MTPLFFVAFPPRKLNEHSFTKLFVYLCLPICLFIVASNIKINIRYLKYFCKNPEGMAQNMAYLLTLYGTLTKLFSYLLSSFYWFFSMICLNVTQNYYFIFDM